MLAVIDTETTGLGDEDKVLEMAVVTMSAEGGVTSAWSSLFSCDAPIAPEARAAHHITDAELRSAPPPLVAPIAAMLDGAVVAAHNLEFDERMIRQTWDYRLTGGRLCTYRCARHVWPDAPGYSNQVLRYWLDLEVPGADGLPAHRALADALVTAGILQVMLRDRTPEQLVKLTSIPALLRNVRGGKYHGQPWESMDEGYLRWVLDPRRSFDVDVKHTANYWLRRKRGVA